MYCLMKTKTTQMTKIWLKLDGILVKRLWLPTFFFTHKPHPFPTVALKLTIRSTSIQSKKDPKFFFFNNPFDLKLRHDIEEKISRYFPYIATLKVKCEISAPLESPNRIAKIITIIRQINPSKTNVNLQNSNQCCYVGLFK